jgi:hypothetical protein
MRQTRDDRYGFRLRALIVVLWRGGLRIQEALALGERELDPARGSLLVRSGKGGRRREIGKDAWGFDELRPRLGARVALPVGPRSASSTGPPAGGPGRARTCVPSSAGSPPKPGEEDDDRAWRRAVSGAASLRTSCALPTPSSSLVRACRST